VVKSKRSREGYLEIDHTFSPGVPDELTKPLGLITAPAGTKLESATVCCNHCNKIVVLNPNRSRPRGYCANCDSYICDMCEFIRKTRGCITIKQIISEVLETNAKNLNLKEI
jgi:hypothetical protein